jgi:hypothetical protein
MKENEAGREEREKGEGRRKDTIHTFYLWLFVEVQ